MEPTTERKNPLVLALTLGSIALVLYYVGYCLIVVSQAFVPGG